jgi:hypothetical protein
MVSGGAEEKARRGLAALALDGVRRDVVIGGWGQ